MASPSPVYIERLKMYLHRSNGVVGAIWCCCVVCFFGVGRSQILLDYRRAIKVRLRRPTCTPEDLHGARHRCSPNEPLAAPRQKTRCNLHSNGWWNLRGWGCTSSKISRKMRFNDPLKTSLIETSCKTVKLFLCRLYWVGQVKRRGKFGRNTNVHKAKQHQTTSL